MSWWWKCGSKSSYSINWQVPRLSHRSKYFLLWSRVGTTWRQLVPSSIKANLYHCCCYMHLIQLCWGFSSCIRVYVLALYFILLFILLFFNFIVIHKCLTILFLYDYVCSMYLNYIHFSINPLHVCQGSLFTPKWENSPLIPTSRSLTDSLNRPQDSE